MPSVPDVIGSETWQQCIYDGAAGLGITLPPGAVAAFAVYAGLLQQYNRHINLTRITRPLEVAVKHFVDSLAALPLIHPDAVILDMGAGAGFPGLALKIAQPRTRVLLVDSRQKKVHFLQHVIRELGLQQITAEHARLEDPRFQARYANTFEIITTRALGALPTLIDWAAPLLTLNGRLIAYKGPEADDEIRAFRQQTGVSAALDWKIQRHGYTLPLVGQKRWLVVLQSACDR